MGDCICKAARACPRHPYIESADSLIHCPLFNGEQMGFTGVLFFPPIKLGESNRYNNYRYDILSYT